MTKRQKYMKKYRATHRIEIAEYRAAHREEIAAYRSVHREEINNQSAEYYAAHREGMRKKHSKYNAAHREEIAKYAAERYVEHRADINKQNAKYDKSHRSEDIWRHMHRRAGNRDGKHPSYANVRVCRRWSGSKGQANFIKDMGQPPTGTSISRYVDTGDYKPSNCAWHTPKQQAEEHRKKQQRQVRKRK